ncbi:MAG: nickel pincer cofactor biosynthesis protein LarC [Candidatus Margulisbacteria bacterium]|nr:nickel pincer cofactor biosynthesis protein LarC [Candidatus Margulisiibacteriota bacterium]
MKIIYFDCPTGIAGNMILGALIDAGLSEKHLKKELKKLALDGYQLKVSRQKSNGLSASFVEVKTKEQHHHRRLPDILKLIDKSKLDQEIKDNAKAIFKRLAQAEARVHGTSVNKVHFHEVGAVDAIVDIVGACIGFYALDIEEIYCSPLNVGKGTIEHTHGTLSVPSPATLELLKGIPFYSNGIRQELVTPTGAAIVTTLARNFGDIPRIKAISVGLGLGNHKLEKQANMLRVIIGEMQLQTEHDAVLEIEANIDDMDPKRYNNAIRQIIRAGALDCWISPILMKKERGAVKLSVLCELGDKDRILEAVFKSTTSFGTRMCLVTREKLKKSFRKVSTKHGKARVKHGCLGTKLVTISPEYEDYNRIAKKHHIPIQKVYNDIIKNL